jgi:signal transduction histidine kinase
MSAPAGDRDEDAREHALLMSMLGHDLRNPLSSILMGLDRLRRGRRLNDSEHVLVERLHASAWRMSGLVDQLLDFERSRLGGNIPLARRQFDLGGKARTSRCHRRGH